MAPVGSIKAPEAKARARIDAALEAAGWDVQDYEERNPRATLGVAVREFPLTTGFADYLLFVDGKPVGVLEAKPAGHTLSGVEGQAQKYTEGLPANLKPPVSPLPFMYVSTGSETELTNLLDPKPRSRSIFSIHQPETLAEWLAAKSLDAWVKENGPQQGGFYTAADDTRPSSLRARLQTMPPVDLPGLWPNKVRAIENLERSLKQDRPRALIQMATGSGKTLLAVTALYRLIKFGGARRVLFLVDRANLGEQAEKEFEGYRTPDDQRKFTELYNVQRLTSNKVGSSSKVVISTIQRLYSVLKGEPELDPEMEEGSQFLDGSALVKEPLPVVYNPAIPPEYFDVIFIDECHRSIYSLWRQVLEYFDAYLIGLTATPAKHTFGFFHKNLVEEYGHDKAVADGVNVDHEVYRIRTKITARGSTIEAEPGTVLTYRNRLTRDKRWELPDEDVTYTAGDLDRSVVAKDQIRLVIQTFRDRVLKEAFPDRKHVPKTLIFAKDDSHAEDIVKEVREQFGEGNAFCQKITYRTTGATPKQLIQDFRNSFYPRIAVTVDLIATGTDIKPIEIVMFMRSVKSRVLYEQMKGRGVRVISPSELQSVTPDAVAKTHYLLVDCVGVTEAKMSDTQPLEQKRGVSMKALLDHVTDGGTDAQCLSSLASRLARLDKRCGPQEKEQIAAASNGATLQSISHALVEALDADVQVEKAREMFSLGPHDEPSDNQVFAAAEALAHQATLPLVTQPKLRKVILDVKKSVEQLIDDVSQDELLTEETGLSPEAKEKAQALVQSFREYLEENRDEIEALQFFYSIPHKKRPAYEDIQALANAIQAPPRQWTPDKLWRAYEMLEQSKVRGASSKRLLTDVVSLVRFALEQDDELVPHTDRVRERFVAWLAQQSNKGRAFSGEQLRWLEMMRDHVASSWEIGVDDFELTPFAEEGGLGKARAVFGKDLGALLRELNEVLAA